MAEAVLRAHEVDLLRGSRTLLHGVSMGLRTAELVALVGPNGAGKSSLVRVLGGLWTPDRGTVELFGRPLKSWSGAERARHLAYVPQRTRLYAPLRVRDVVAQGRAPYRTLLGAPRASDRAAVEDSLRRCDLGALADRPFTRLSEGEARRVLIARALATGAKALLLDEPTAALDLRHALELFTLLRTLVAEGYALLCVLHDLGEVVRFADRAIVLAEGRARAEGPPAEALDEATLRAVWGVEREPDVAPRYRLPSREPPT